MQALPNTRPTLRKRHIAHSPVVLTGQDSQREQASEAAASGALRFGDAAPVASSLDSAALLRGQKAVQIAHNGAVYKLQATKLGKLILTK